MQKSVYQHSAINLLP